MNRAEKNGLEGRKIEIRKRSHRPLLGIDIQCFFMVAEDLRKEQFLEDAGV